MRKLLLLVFLLFAAAPVFSQGAYKRQKIWEREIAAFLAIDKKQTPPSHPVVFTGSSSIRMWSTLRTDFPGVNVMNRGFGGSQLDDLVYYAPQIVAPHRPKMFVVYSGENDIAAGETPENVLADFKDLIAFRDKELPATRVVFISMKPSILRWKFWPEMKRGNEMIAAEAERHKKVRFVDISAAMLGTDGKPRPELFGPDGLHMSPQGYALWRSILAPIVR